MSSMASLPAMFSCQQQLKTIQEGKWDPIMQSTFLGNCLSATHSSQGSTDICSSNVLQGKVGVKASQGIKEHKHWQRT